MIRCVHCNKENEEIFTYCLNCGKPLEQSLSSYRPRPARAEKKTSFRLVAVKTDGTAGNEYPLELGINRIGQRGPEVSIPDDPRIAAEHATLDVGDDLAFLEDLSTPYGTFIRIRDEMALVDGDRVRIGHALFQIQLTHPLPPTTDGSTWLGSAGAKANHTGRLLRLGPDDTVIEAHLLTAQEIVIGRSAGDILMPDDPFVSSRHAAISVVGGTCKLRDLGSTNGCFLRIRGRVAVQPGGVILVGQHLLRFRRLDD